MTILLASFITRNQTALYLTVRITLRQEMINFKLLTIFLALIFGPQLSPAQELPLYETGKQLLAAVNKERRKMGCSEFSYDGLTVWLASQAKLGSGENHVSATTTRFLRQLIARKRFTVSVMLITEYRNDINLTDDIHSKDRLALPSYHSLTLQIPYIPWNSKDADGQQIKADSDYIEIATALKKVKPVRQAHASRPSD